MRASMALVNAANSAYGVSMYVRVFINYLAIWLSVSAYVYAKTSN